MALPGLGTMRFGLSAKAVEDVNDVKTGLIKTRRIVFTPSTDLKQELKDTAVIITCYDRNGVEVKRVTSTDPGTVEEPDDTDPNGTGGSSTGGNTSGSNTEGGSNTGGNTSGDNTGGGSTGGDDYHDPDGGTNSDE